jgi:hypothetical protein
LSGSLVIREAVRKTGNPRGCQENRRKERGGKLAGCPAGRFGIQRCWYTGTESRVKGKEERREIMRHDWNL